MQLFRNTSFVMRLLICNNSKWCLPLFVSPFYCTVPLLKSFLLNITTCTVAYTGRRIFERKAHFAIALFRKGGWAYFQGWACFWEIISITKSISDPKLPTTFDYTQYHATYSRTFMGKMKQASHPKVLNAGWFTCRVHRSTHLALYPVAWVWGY